MGRSYGDRRRQQKNQDNKSSLVMFLVLFSGFVAIIGLIYIYGDFSDRKSPQLAGFIEVHRTTPIASSPVEDASKFIGGGQQPPAQEQNKETDDENSDGLVERLLEGIAAADDRTSRNEQISYTNENSVREEEKEPESSAGISAQLKKPMAAKEKSRDKAKKFTTRVFFIRATDSGYLSLRGLAIEVEDSQSPLTFTIEALLKGPSLSERSHGMYSLIPEGSRLISATVKEGIAYLDFNEDFQFNPLGTDGYQAQLQQVVYTATEFPSVQSVQILLEGKKIDYLHEGIYVGAPLSRESFRSL